MTGVLLLASASPFVPQVSAQRDRDHRQFYSGMRDHVRDNRYNERYRQYEYDRYHNQGGIGPGYGALIGAGGGAALGALFGGGLKGALIGGAAGAGLGALGGKLAQGDNHNDNYYYRH